MAPQKIIFFRGHMNHIQEVKIRNYSIHCHNWILNGSDDGV
jgi:hypothetical protein